MSMSIYKYLRAAMLEDTMKYPDSYVCSVRCGVGERSDGLLTSSMSCVAGDMIFQR